MTPNSAYKLIHIEKGISYSPKPASGDSFASSDPIIYSLLCTHNSANPDSTVKILTVGQIFDGDAPIEIPAIAFKPGVHYNIYLDKLVDDCGGKVKFVGYMYKTVPLTL
jgi:hypothetical protein